ncbi:amidohydrolase family protein [Ruania suaedae]|uniref:amidohydrolase family protein n=1 Tax=Ruania suaedae TaxID=2897774 RepID=UPI001E5CA288|nr:amidohydrolase family protein [Ruania suaedae]UFU01826.1 amidohydrolase family protein [Ruania suaedae]
MPRRLSDAVSYVRAGDRDYLLDAAICGVAQWAVDETLAVTEAEAMRTFGLVNQAHLLETDEQLAAQREKFDWYVRAGARGERMIVGHFVHPSEEIVDACAEAGCVVSRQPVANGRLASGAADVIGLRDRGVRLGLGLDDHACSDVSDAWQNMRVGPVPVPRCHWHHRAAAADVLRMQALGAAEIIGVADQVGSLEMGKRADLLVVDPRRPDVGPLHDPLASYVLSMTLRNLRAVYVGAQQVADDGGAHLSADGRLNAEVHERFGPRPELAR